MQILHNAHKEKGYVGLVLLEIYTSTNAMTHHTRFSFKFITVFMVALKHLQCI
jgi:hypothetical protein